MPIKVLFRRLKLQRLFLFTSIFINICFVIYFAALNVLERLDPNLHCSAQKKLSVTNCTLGELKTEEPYTEGALAVNLSKLAKHAQNVEELSVLHGGNVQFGGWWNPPNNTNASKVAVIIPIRNREQQLKVFLWHMHPILQKQELSYRIFVVEQIGDTMFNKGAIYNIGFLDTLNIGDFDCYIFHDVDLLTENERNRYDCKGGPRHMSAAVDTLKYKLPHLQIFGGVEALSKNQFLEINGFSNMFWGWGGEDDDLYTRITFKGYKLTRPSMKIGRYKMNTYFHYRSDGVNKDNVKMYHDEKSRIKRIYKDGLNQVAKLDFTKAVVVDLMYTRISINLKRWKKRKTYTSE